MPRLRPAWPCLASHARPPLAHPRPVPRRPAAPCRTGATPADVSGGREASHRALRLKRRTGCSSLGLLCRSSRINSMSASSLASASPKPDPERSQGVHDESGLGLTARHASMSSWRCFSLSSCFHCSYARLAFESAVFAASSASSTSRGGEGEQSRRHVKPPGRACSWRSTCPGSPRPHE
jgi:hypothetical protein